MIILDTNVISEVMRGPAADPGVLSWVRSLPDQPVTTVINRAEIMAGVALLPDGHRRDRLWAAAESAFDSLGACLPLMPECASVYAGIVASRRAAGRPVGSMDALIGSIARVAGAALATRDVEDFEDFGVDVINPWQVEGTLEVSFPELVEGQGDAWVHPRYQGDQVAGPSTGSGNAPRAVTSSRR